MATTNKKKSTKPTKQRTTASTQKQSAQKTETGAKKQLAAIILFGVAILLLCLVLIGGGGLWGILREVIFGLFGFCSYIWPLLLIYIAVIASLNKDYSRISFKVAETVLLIFFVSAAVCIFSNDGDVNLLENVKDAYNTYSVNGSTLGSGAAGAFLGSLILLITGASKAAAGAIILVLIFVFIMLITGTTLISFFKGLWKPVEKAKTYTEEKIEQNANREPKEMKKTQKKIDDIDPEKDLGPVDVDEKNDIFARVEPYSNKADIKDATTQEKQEKHAVMLDDIIKKASGNTEEKLKDSVKTPVAEVKQDKPLAEDEDVEQIPYSYPPIDCLSVGKAVNKQGYETELKANAEKLVNTLRSFGVETRIVDICRGPSVTRYEIQPAAGVKISKITNLADDIALNLAASGVRIEAPIPNKAAVGIEIPNRNRNTVTIREIVDTDDFKNAKSKLNIALGKDITGKETYADLQKMPHLLIAGTTGSGKSVCLNSMIISILYNASPDEVKLIMIDPKQVEFLKYNGIPHLLVPVVSDPRKASGALAWAVTEMLQRYKTFADNGVRDIAGYNSICDSADLKKMPQVVIFIDELSDLMMAAPNEVEDSICRLAQMARAAGMHLVVATQRPSVDVITGVIKSNIPSRIALSVSSQIDSRIIIDAIGAEKLLGNGDMLYYPMGIAKPVRIQGCYISDNDVEKVVNFIKSEASATYDDDVMQEIERQAAKEKKKLSSAVDDGDDDSPADEMLPKAIEVVVESQQASTTLLQRKLKLGYARAARIVDDLEQRGIVGPYEGSKPRKVLISKQQWLEMNALAQGGAPVVHEDIAETEDGDKNDYYDENRVF